MIILDCIQGSPEWNAARVGIPSASVMDKIITTKGEVSKSGGKLMYQLAGERIIGRKEESYTNAAMERGIELEAEARALFSLTTGLDVDEVGLCYYDERRDRSASPDGLIVDRKEGLEIKCPSLAVHVGYLLSDKLPTDYFQQVQGSLYITGYDCWHFFSYYPGMKPFHKIVGRDEMWIAKLSKVLDDFVGDLEETYNLLIKQEGT
jgi:hypothetical protein